jgi:streptogramin lyase
MTNSKVLATFGAAGLALVLVWPAPGHAADLVLSGAIKSAAGEKMAGVTVSAKAVGSTITTSVFTDEDGAYYFPPMPAGGYRVWAQAISFETAKGDVDLGTMRRQDFTLQPITDFERQVRQLPGDLILAGLPEETADDKRMKRIIRNNCTGCHTPSYPMQHRFDENGWYAIIQTMKSINFGGVYNGQQARLNPVLNFFQKDLAAYLARARGPGQGSFKIVSRPRPSGEAARAVFREYDLPLNPDLELPARIPPNNGSDWTMGTPTRSGSLSHDATADADGNLWFTALMGNRTFTVGQVDAKTGQVRPYKVNTPSGMAASSHGILRDQHGTIWFNVHLARGEAAKGALGKIDPRTGKLEVYIPPASMSTIDGPVTLDYDPTGNILAGTVDGALRFDPVAERFTEFKSVTPRNAKGGASASYGMASDPDGNLWWTQISFDILSRSDGRTGKSVEYRLPPLKDQMPMFTAADHRFYDDFAPDEIGTPLPWSQGPRRIGMDRSTGVLWIANSWAGSLTRVDTRTGDMSFVPFPNPTGNQPYHAIADNKHNVWASMWTTDQIARYEPSTGRWTMFDLPTRGTEVRLLSPRYLPNGDLELTFAYPRSSKIAVMTVRSEADLVTLEHHAQSASPDDNGGAPRPR